MDKPKLIIGIDPDVEASGFAVYNATTKKIESLKTYDLFDVFHKIILAWQLNEAENITVVIEAGWLKKRTNWHQVTAGYTPEKRAAINQRIAGKVSANHEIGKQIEKFCIKKGIPYMLKKPLGYSAWSHTKFCAYTGWDVKKLTNPETRVAGLLVIGM